MSVANYEKQNKSALDALVKFKLESFSNGKNSYNILIRKTQGKRPLKRPSHR
jgi:hypothetical protein